MALPALGAIITKFAGPALAKIVQSGGSQAVKSFGKQAVKQAATKGGPTSFGQAIKDPKTFGDLMGGKIKPQEVHDQVAANKLTEQENEAREAATGNLKDFGKALSGGVGGVLAAKAAMESFAKSQVASQELYREFSSTIARAHDELELGRFSRTARTAQNTEYTAKLAANARNQLEEQNQIYNQTWDNLMNGISLMMDQGRVIAGYMFEANTSVGQILSFLRLTQSKENPENLASKFVRDLKGFDKKPERLPPKPDDV